MSNIYSSNLNIRSAEGQSGVSYLDNYLHPLPDVHLVLCSFTEISVNTSKNTKALHNYFKRMQTC